MVLQDSKLLFFGTISFWGTRCSAAVRTLMVKTVGYGQAVRH